MESSKTGISAYIVLLLICEFYDAASATGLLLTIIRALVFAWSSYYFIKTLITYNREPDIIKILMLFYIILAIYGIMVVIEGKTFLVGMREVRRVVTLSYIVKVSWSLLPIFVFYDYAKRGILTHAYIKKWLYLFCISVTICYFLTLQNTMSKNDEDEVTNNGGYLVLSFIPLLIFFRLKSWKQIIFLGAALLLVILSVKRGAILIGFIIAIIYFIFIYHTTQRNTRYGVILLFVVALSASYYMLDRIVTSSELFQERINDTLEGNTSGRDVIQSFFIDYYFNVASTKEQLFGGGANKTLELFNMYAHNDWIELAINQGLLGMLFYLLYWMAFIKLCLKKNMPPTIRCILIILFTDYFLKTFFSMSYTEYTLYSSLAFGYCIVKAYDGKYHNLIE